MKEWLDLLGNKVVALAIVIMLDYIVTGKQIGRAHV